MNKKLIASTAALLTVMTLISNTSAAAPVPQTAGQERVYALASVSKVYVTTAIMQLKDRGLINIDAPITDYIPEFTMADERYKDITVRMLMNHTSGIMGSTLRNEFLFGDNDKSKYDHLLENLKTQTLKADPGAYAAYCNDGFTLLELIVERVSGMEFTSYIEENIAVPLNLTQTGTAINADTLGTQVNIYSGGLNYDYEYCMALGSGGVYATASDVANFGASFWTGNDVLLSEESKDEMGTMWNEDAYDNYMDTCGLGWDYAEQIQYEQAGVHVVGKGGDLQTMHSFLLVAPDNDISVCVLVSGGSSTLASLMCQNLLDIALEEQGIVVDPIEMPDVQTVDIIPEEYGQYEGYYTMYGSLANVTIDDKLTITAYLANGRTTVKKYMYTEDRNFVEVDLNGNIKPNITLIDFREENGKVYITSDAYNDYPDIGTTFERSYLAEKLEENNISPEVQTAWNSYDGMGAALFSDAYSSCGYDLPFVQISLMEEVPGYIMVSMSTGSRLLKIVDETHAVHFTTMPSSSNRDLADMTINPDGTIDTSLGQSFLPLQEIPELTKNITEISLTTEKAAWYRIGEDIAYDVINVDRSENSTIYVYNKFFEIVYTTHYTGADDIINLPEDGYIVFLGDTGDIMTIN